MKKYIGIAFALAAVIVYVGCGSKSSNTGLRNGRAGGTNGTAVTQAAPTMAQSVLGWGRVTPASNQASINFLSTDFVTGDVGSTVGCQTGTGLTGTALPCGVEFTVSTQPASTSTPITFSQGNLATILQSGASANPTGGYLTMIFWDSMTGTTASDGSILTPIPVVIPMAAQNSLVQGNSSSNSVILTFTDGVGTVQLQGSVQGSTYQGNVNYVNSVNVNQGAATAQGNLGSFAVAACSIMACQ